MNLEIERNKELEPSLAEMTEAAIKTLSANDDGYVLMVEGKGRKRFICPYG